MTGGNSESRLPTRPRLRYAPDKHRRIHVCGAGPEDRPLLALAHERRYAGKRIA